MIVATRLTTPYLTSLWRLSRFPSFDLRNLGAPHVTALDPGTQRRPKPTRFAAPVLPRARGFHENTPICGAESPNHPRLPKLEVASSNLVRRFRLVGPDLALWQGIRGGGGPGSVRTYAGVRGQEGHKSAATGSGVGGLRGVRCGRGARRGVGAASLWPPSHWRVRKQASRLSCHPARNAKFRLEAHCARRHRGRGTPSRL